MRPTAPPPAAFSSRLLRLTLPVLALVTAALWWGVYCLLF